MIWSAIKHFLVILLALSTMFVAAGSFECAESIGGAVLYLLGAAVLGCLTRCVWESILRDDDL